jgi:hypothetical protein
MKSDGHCGVHWPTADGMKGVSSRWGRHRAQRPPEWPVIERRRRRAEHKWGQLYSAGEKAPAGRPPNNTSIKTTDFERPKTPEEMGVTRDQSSRWQKLGRVPDDEFEAAIAGYATVA